MDYLITWKDAEKKYEQIEGQLSDFFNDLCGGKIVSPEGIKLDYREGQNKFAIAVMKAIKNKDILLIEAGVGIGKSFGYLLPIFYTKGGIQSFDRIVISTSSIALEDQLLKDIKTVSTLLGIEIKTEATKGINNYACLKNINKALESSKEKGDVDSVTALENLKREITKYETCDKSRLSKLNNPLWKRIQVNGGCDRCELKSICEFQKQQARISSSEILVTNHTQLANMLALDSKTISNASAVVIDEAHNFEEQLRLYSEGSLNIQSMIERLYSIKDKLSNSENYDTYYYQKDYNAILNKILESLLSAAMALRHNANTIFKKSDNKHAELKEVDKLNIKIDNAQVSDSLKKLVQSLAPFKRVFAQIPPIYGLEKDINYINNCIKRFNDMMAGSQSKYIYWVRYVDDEHIEIRYTIKDLSRFYDRLYDKDKPIVFTSGTMTITGDYDKISSSLALDTRDFKEGLPIASPYDYKNNTLFYFDDKMVSPKSGDRTAYITALAIKIKELIEVTEGKALVLFTSKSDMKAVYTIVNNMGLKTRVLMQDDKNASSIKNEFTSDENSSLFATGAFWEGIDIKGKTLSNLIIARLPFPIQDPVVEYKKDGLSKTAANELTVTEMLMKLSQGTGRLIRCESDTGIVCCLDSRIVSYLGAIKKTLPFGNYTCDMDKVLKFSEEKILLQQSGQKTLHLEPIDK